MVAKLRHSEHAVGMMIKVILRNAIKKIKKEQKEILWSNDAPISQGEFAVAE